MALACSGIDDDIGIDAVVVAFAAAAANEENDRAGEGTISGLIARTRIVPAMPTMVERVKPGLERSMRYQRTGLTRARVRESCRVDCQGRRRYRNTMRSNPFNSMEVFGVRYSSGWITSKWNSQSRKQCQ